MFKIIDDTVVCTRKTGFERMFVVHFIIFIMFSDKKLFSKYIHWTMCILFPIHTTLDGVSANFRHLLANFSSVTIITCQGFDIHFLID